MNAKLKASSVSIGVNIILGVSKLIAGFISGSAALIADGIHSSLDVLSSVVSFLGIKAAQKERDEKHPYGFYGFENIAGLVIVFLLALSALWIIYEGTGQLISYSPIKLSYLGFGVVIFSIVANELIARYKFKVGREENSLSLVADAQHSRADVISSIGVLVGLILVKFFPFADGLLAIIIGFYIIYESWQLSRETIDQLVGVKDEEIEEEIKKISQEKKIEVSEIQSRKIGSASFAEITVKLCPDLPVQEAEKKTKDLQQSLVDQISRLDQVVIQVESHNYSSGTIRQTWGKRLNWKKEFPSPSSLGVEAKNGYRIIIPIEDGRVYDHLGAPQYLIVDKRDGEIKQKKIVDNPFKEEKMGGGMRMIRTFEPDEVITAYIGQGARKRAEDFNIKITEAGKAERAEDLIK